MFARLAVHWRLLPAHAAAFRGRVRGAVSHDLIERQDLGQLGEAMSPERALPDRGSNEHFRSFAGEVLGVARAPHEVGDDAQRSRELLSRARRWCRQKVSCEPRNDLLDRCLLADRGLGIAALAHVADDVSVDRES